MQKNKKLVIVSLLVIFLVLGLAIFFIKRSGLNYGDEVGICANFSDEEDFYLNAMTEKESCDCIKDKNKQEECKKDSGLYFQAVNQLNDKFCENIVNDSVKETCFSQVKENLTTLDKSEVISVYARTHDEKLVEELETAISKDPQDISNLTLLALAYAGEGLKEQERGNSQDEYVNKAIEVVEKAKKIDPTNAEVYRVEGYVYEIKPDFNKSVSAYNKAIEIDENNYMAYAGLGHVNRLMSNIGGAIYNFKKAEELDIDKGYTLIYSNLCSLEYSSMKMDEASKYCELVINSGDTDILFKSDAYFTLAMINLSDLNKSKSYLNEALLLTPNNPSLYVLMARISLNEKDFDKAINSIEKALEFSPKKTYAYVIYAEVLYAKKDYNGAINKVDKGINVINEDVSLLPVDKPAILRKLYQIKSDCYGGLNDITKKEEFKNKSDEAIKFN